jgi:hypothetical protein
LLAHGWWFSPGTPVSSTNKTDHQDINAILLKVALNTITHRPYNHYFFLTSRFKVVTNNNPSAFFTFPNNFYIPGKVKVRFKAINKSDQIISI